MKRVRNKGRGIQQSSRKQDDRGVWHIGNQDIENYITEPYRRTVERIDADEFEGGGQESDEA